MGNGRYKVTFTQTSDSWAPPTGYRVYKIEAWGGGGGGGSAARDYGLSCVDGHDGAGSGGGSGAYAADNGTRTGSFKVVVGGGGGSNGDGGDSYVAPTNAATSYIVYAGGGKHGSQVTAYNNKCNTTYTADGGAGGTATYGTTKTNGVSGGSGSVRGHTHSSGGGGAVVSTSTTEPSNPTNNMIWIGGE